MMSISSRRAAAPHLLPALVLAALGLLVLLGGCGQKKDAASQVAAKVNKAEVTVHQINFLLSQQRNVRPEQVDAASRVLLERLIDQEIAVQKADELKLEKDPRVQQQLEMARRELLARAYLEKIGEAAVKPTADEVKQYYDAKPALFSERRVYNLQEILIEAKPEQVGQIKDMLGAAKSMPEFAEKLKAMGVRFAANQAVRTAEQLPLPLLDTIAKLKDGQATVVPAPAGLQIIALVGSRAQTLTFDQAKPFIEQYLLGERRRKLIADQIKTGRQEAKVSYVGKFAEKPASGAAGAPPEISSSLAGEADHAASAGLSSTDISKGMGLK